MGENKYCNTNMCYLYECNGITPEELRMSLGMSKLQFYNYGGGRAIKTISKYFNISINEFVYEDLFLLIFTFIDFKIQVLHNWFQAIMLSLNSLKVFSLCCNFFKILQRFS